MADDKFIFMDGYACIYEHNGARDCTHTHSKYNLKTVKYHRL